MATQEGCRTVLELFLSGGESQPSSEPVTLVRRALRTVEGEALEATRVLTWNINGEKRAAMAPETFDVRDKLAWLREEVLLLQPGVVALQECVSETPVLAGLYRLSGVARAHHGYVHLYVKQNIECEDLGQIVEGVPAVIAKFFVGQQQLCVVAVHLPANRKGDLPEQLEGPAGRRHALCGIARYLQDVEGPVVLLGDLNVRSEEVSDLLELAAWRDVWYAQKSYAPRINDFDGPGSRDWSKPSVGDRYDRIWIRGAVWAQNGCLTGTARRFCDGKPFCLSDHFAVYALLDVHECHGADGVAAVREKRRVDLGQLRDMEHGRLREHVRAQEELVIAADRRAQIVAQEERVQESVRQLRAELRQQRKRHATLRDEVNGEAGLFVAAATSGLRRVPRPTA